MIRILLFLILGFYTNNIFAEKPNSKNNTSPPYQIKIQGKLSETSIRALDCIFKRMDQPYDIRIAPWKRAQFEVKKGRAHGFFTSMPFKEVEKHSTLSAPLALEKWYWFFKETPPLQTNDKTEKLLIGVIKGSNQKIWLKARGYKIGQEVKTTEQLFKLLLEKNRIDTFLVDWKTFEEQIAQSNFKIDQFNSKFSKYTPFGVYFSNQFLKEYPQFLKIFNENVSKCVPEATHLHKQEEQKLQEITAQKIMKWAIHPQVIDAIKTQNQKHRSLNPSQVNDLDQKWRKEVKSFPRPFINQILANPLSQYLKKIQKESNGLYAEIFVMDNKGLNVGQSNITSDYWQGDEEKFKKAFGKGKDIIFIDNIEYDESSKKFQSQISIPLHDPSTGAPIGALTIGVDVERALSVE